MSKAEDTEDRALRAPAIDRTAARDSIPLTTRLGIEIPKPKDWQAFQRNCVLLFRAELNDPHAQEYGRAGQKQRGIDILARRDGREDYFVGVQCRLITTPLKKAKILSDARAALTLKAGLKELIFATTAPDDTGACDAAIEVSRELQAEGHDIKVIVYGWGQLQTLIAPHEVAYNAFHPSAVASSLSQAPGPGIGTDFASCVAGQVVEQMRSAGLAIVPSEDRAAASGSEDPGLHARIDTFRDLFKNNSQPLLAEDGLLKLLKNEDLSSKPWAHFRIETNLGSIALDLGREAEAAARFETAHAIRSDDPNALANLALARTIQGRFKEAMTIARAALDGKPRADHAVLYLLQAAARSDWDGDPEALIPADLVGTAQADIGLAEFLRRREAPGWAERSLALARRHADTPNFKRIRAIAVLSLAIGSTAIVPGGYGPVTTSEINTAADDMKALVTRCLDVGFADVYDLTAYLNNAANLLRLCERHDESEALLLRGLPIVGADPQLRRLLAISQSMQGRDDKALATLAGDTDPENQIFSAELQASTGDVAGALKRALAIETADLPERLQRLRWRQVGEMSLRLDDEPNFSAAITGLRTINPADVTASLLEIRWERKRLEYAARDGLKTAGYDNGKIVMQEVSAEVIDTKRNDLGRAIAWAEAKTVISPIVAGEDLPAAFREHLRIGRSDVFDSVALSRQRAILLVTDDQPTREIKRLLGGDAGAWLHVVFGVALKWKHINADQYIQWLAQLIKAGHSYLGVSGLVLARAARLDAAAAGEVPGDLFRTLSLMIGGRGAEPASHINAVIECLNELWGKSDAVGFRQPITGHLLRQLVSERTGDYAIILRTVLKRTGNLPTLTSYILDWLQGHFMAKAVLQES